MSRFFNQLWVACTLFFSSQILLAQISVPQGQLSNAVEPLHYQLELTVDPAKSHFSGITVIEVKLNVSTNLFYLHGQDLKNIRVVLFDAEQKQYQAQVTTTDVEGVLAVSTNQLLAPSNYKVKFEYEAPFNENLQGLHRVKDGDQYYAFTQMESIYARYAFPSFDEPRFKTPYDIDLVIPEKLVAISNTPEKSSESLNNGWKKISFERSKPSPTYLLAIAVGDFDVVNWEPLPETDVRKRTVPLRGIATKGKGKKLDFALENTRAIVESLEDYFQIEYPFQKLDILAVPDFAAGAMENSGAITYREQLLLLDENASVGQIRSYKSVHAHELAHQWFGNLVTPVWWNDIWLNEAFATWMAATALERQWPGEEWRRRQINNSKGAMDSDSIPSARKIRNPIESNGDIITAFDGITYQKGAGVLSMVETFMGEDNFRKGVQKYMHKYAWKNTTAIDFFETIASVLEPERAQAVVKSFRNFVEQAGVPLLNINKSCDDERTLLNINQERYAPLGTEFKEKTLWSIPACMTYQVDGEIKQQCEVFSQAKQLIKLNVSGCADWVLPNTHAAGYYRFNFGPQGWKELLAHLDKVDAQEANAILDSMKSSFDSGKLSVADLFDVIPSTLTSDSWEVATSGIEILEVLIGYADESEKVKLRKIAADIYRHSADSIGFNDDTSLDRTDPAGANQRRTALIDFMGNTAKDPVYRKKLTEMAVAYIGYKTDGKLNDEAVIPALRRIAMSVAVQELGRPYLEALVSHFKQSTDGTLRGRLIGSMTATEEPEIAEYLIQLSFSEGVRDNEKSAFLFQLVTKKELDSVMWPWLKENFDKVVADLPTNYHSFTPYLFFGECDDKYNKRLDNFLKPKLGGLIGADRNFVKAKDYLKQCLAKKARAKPEITSLLAKLENSNSL